VKLLKSDFLKSGLIFCSFRHPVIDVTENRPQKVSECEGIFQMTSVVNFIVIPRIRHVEKTQRNEWEQKEKFTEKKNEQSIRKI